MRLCPRQICAAIRSAMRPGVDGIHSEEVFKAILDHERAVAERNIQFIAVLAFNLKDARIRSKMATKLGQIFSDRLRVTDVAGWLDGVTVGVMLPQTRFKDAAMVGENICQRMLLGGFRLDYSIYLFPDDPNGDSGKQKEFDLVQGLADPHAAGPYRGSVSPATNLVAQSSAAPPAQDRKTNAFSMDDICVHPLPLWKRCLDVFLSVLAVTVCGPLMLLITIGIKIVSPGPVLFRQERVGFRGKRFMLYKFRSMKCNADTLVHKEHLAHLMSSGTKLTKLDKADARLIPFGRIFRASGLDELPQLFNIIRGDMSFIGPRPCVPYEYDKFHNWHKHRCNAYPGLTGLWQVSGKNKTTFTEMMRLDNAYVRRQTFVRDVKILLRTFPAVWRQIREMAADKR